MLNSFLGWFKKENQEVLPSQIYIPLQDQGIKLPNPNTDHNSFNKTHSTEPILRALPVNLIANFYYGAFREFLS